MKIVSLRDIESKKANIILKNFMPIPENAVTLLSASGGTGKAIYTEEKVLTPNGWDYMKNIKANDYVIGSNGNKTKVTGVYPQGIRQSYKITFADKTEVICDSEHLWTVKSSSRKSGTYTVSQLLEMGYFRDRVDKRYGTTQREFFYGIPICKNGYEFGNDENVELNPYLLGVLLGDGSLSNGNAEFTNSNLELIKEVEKLLPEEDCLIITKDKNSFNCRIKRKVKNSKISRTKEILIKLGLFGKLSVEKFIPNEYKNATLETRKLLIKGLIDTDGHINKKNGNLDEYSTSSEQLAKDFLEVGRSIGMYLTVKSRIPTFKYKNEIKKGHKSFRIYNKIQSNKKIINIEKLDKKEMVCIKIDSKDELFVVNGYNLTHNTRLSLIMADRYIREQNKKVALWLTEDYPGQVRHIFDEMVRAGLTDDNSLDMMDIILEEPPQLAKRETGIFKANYDEIKKIGNFLVERLVGLAIFDPLLAFYGGNENDNSEARVFIQTFATWAKESEITTLIIHHANKEGASRGATAFHDGVRARYELSMPLKEDGNVDEDLKKQGLRVLKIKKDNWGISIPFHALTNQTDEALVKISPSVKTFMSEEPKVTEYNSNSFMESMI